MAYLKSSGVAVNRESLSNVLAEVEPTETPYISSIGKKTVKNTFHSWPVSTLRAPTLANAHVEGFTKEKVAISSPGKVSTYVQLFAETGSVSKTAEAGDVAGVASLYAKAKLDAAISLRKDKELVYLSNQGSRVEEDDDARLTAGVQAWAKTCTDFGVGGAAGGYSAGIVTAATPGTLRAFTMDQIDNVQQKMFDAGGKTTNATAFMGSALKRKFATFVSSNRVANNQATVAGEKEMTIFAGASIYIGSFGRLVVVPHAYALQNTVVISDGANSAEEITYRALETVDLPEDGDRKSFLMTNEAGLAVKHEKLTGVIHALNAAL